MNQVFRQFFDRSSCTYTYLLGDLRTRVALLIDTVQECAERDLQTIREFEFEKVYLINTHVHADHITGNAILKKELGFKAESVCSRFYEKARADKWVGEEDELHVGCFKLNFLHTPGHTSGCISIVDHQNRRVFTGDTLLIRGCGRTDFQGGNSSDLYDSVHKKLFKLPRDYAVFPAHDYLGRTQSSIGEEIDFNPRLSKPKIYFIKIMHNLNLSYPKLIDIAVPRNLNCGYEFKSVKTDSCDLP